MEMSYVQRVLIKDKGEKMKKTKLPYPDLWIGEESEVVQNRFGFGSIELTPEEVAVYDCLMGFERLGMYEQMQKGITWFIKNNIKAYQVLLD